LQDYSVCADPDIISDGDWRLSTGLYPHEKIGGEPMIMIDEFNSARNQAMVADVYLTRDVEFTATPKKCMVPNVDAGSGLTDPVKLEEQVRLKDTMAANLYLMRPSYHHARNRGMMSDHHPLSAPVQPTDTGKKYAV
jgi:hypothetical protein